MTAASSWLKRWSWKVSSRLPGPTRRPSIDDKSVEEFQTFLRRLSAAREVK